MTEELKLNLNLNLQDLNSALSKIDVSLPPVEYIENILKAICDNLGYSFATVIEVDDKGKGHIIASHNLPADYPNRVSSVVEPLLSSPSGEAIETGKIVVVPDVSFEPKLRPWHDIIETYSLKTTVWIPLFRAGKTFGTCVLYDTKTRDVSVKELELLEQIGVMVSIAITSNQYLNELSTEIEKRKVVEDELRQIKDGLEVQVEQRTQQINEINTELQLFKDLMSNSKDAIHIVEPGSGCFLDVNETACLDLGYTREELVNKNVKDIEVTFQNTGWAQIIAEIKGKGHVTLEGVNLRKDGSMFPVEVNVRYTSIPAPVGHTDYIVAIVRDITERKKMEDALHKEHVILDAINIAQSHYILSLIHI